MEEEYRDHMAYMQARQEKEMRDLVERHRYTDPYRNNLYIGESRAHSSIRHTSHPPDILMSI